jgi:hypothetical protein
MTPKMFQYNLVKEQRETPKTYCFAENTDDK